MTEELTRALTQEEIEIEESRQREINSVKKTVLVAGLIGLIGIFVILAYFEWIHPYPNQYRIITNGDIYKVQERNWFFPWHVYDEYDGHYGGMVKRFYHKEEAEEYMEDLREEEARRMEGKPPDPENEWKPLN